MKALGLKKREKEQHSSLRELEPLPVKRTMK